MKKVQENNPMPWHTGNLGVLKKTIEEFESFLPGWWWSIGSCSVSGHASCGPDSAGPDAGLLELPDRTFDTGFHQDYIGDVDTVADALRDVMEQAIEAKNKVQFVA